MRIIRMRGKDVAHADACRCIHWCGVLAKIRVDEVSLGVPLKKHKSQTILVRQHWRVGKQNRNMTVALNRLYDRE